MKSLTKLFLLLFIISLFLWCGCNKEKFPGSIYGIVTDKATGEPIQTAGVELLYNREKFITGSDGQFFFEELKPGKYSILITKSGYSDLMVKDITVNSDIDTKIGIQIEKLPPALRIVDDNGKDIEYLDFGCITGDDSRMFNIFNDGNTSLDWQITVFSDWLSVNKESGSLESGASAGVIAYIDRSKLHEGENKTTIHIISNNGNRQIYAMAFSGEIYTAMSSEITEHSSVFNAIIHHMDNPYTERGFLYSTTEHTPTMNANNTQRTVVQGIELGRFSTKVSELTSGQTYYVRAYMKNNNQISYGNVVNFKTALPPEYITIPLAQIMVQNKDLGYTTYSAAETMCKNSTVGGFNDWRLPTVDECRIIYNYKYLLDGIDSAYYWTRNSVYDHGTGWTHYIFHFGRGFETIDNYVNHFVRSVRSINQ